MYMRAGGQIVDGKAFCWTNWYIDQIILDEPLCKIADYVIPSDWLAEMLDNRYSAYLMTMPAENYN